MAVIKTWQPIQTAPFDEDLELAVIEGSETHALAVRSRRTAHGWINAVNGRTIDVNPTHWRVWQNGKS